jgi:hypothetical protein
VSGHRLHRNIGTALAIALTVLPRFSHAEAAGLDPRLGDARPALSAVLDQASREGLPTDLLRNKIAEGLAKNVAPARIAQVVTQLHDDALAARAFATPLLGHAPGAAALRALIEARAAGVHWDTVASLVRERGETGLITALAALTDLSVRGYPRDRAGVTVVRSLARTEPKALVRLVPELERLRRHFGLTQSEALDALASALEKVDTHADGTLERALHRVEENGGGRGNAGAGPDHGRGPDRDVSGNHGKGK